MKCGAQAARRAAILVVGLMVAGTQRVGAAQGAAPGPPAAGTPAAPPPVVPAIASTPAETLAAADAAIDAGALADAAALCRRLVNDHPTSSEAKEARRALKILEARAAGGAPPSAGPPGATGPLPPLPAVSTAASPGQAPADTVLRLDPYSTRTSERLRLTAWEKLDFGTTAFLYGMSLGASYAVSLDDSQQDVTPIALGALTYTLGSVAYLSVAHPDRGDLPLALAITSYVPTSTLLLSNLLFPDAQPKSTAIAVTVAGLAAVPLALLATDRFNLDPGDTQLVRDAGFWGLVLGTAGSLGFGFQTITTPYGGEYQKEPSGRTIAGWAATGLFGGLALGSFAAAHSEVSLERVRITTWGGYGGGLLATLLAVGARADQADVYRSLAVGSALGLAITFVTTAGLDGIPPETAVVSQLLPHGVTPAVLGAPGLEWGAAPSPLLGFVGALP